MIKNFNDFEKINEAENLKLGKKGLAILKTAKLFYESLKSLTNKDYKLISDFKNSDLFTNVEILQNLDSLEDFVYYMSELDNGKSEGDITFWQLASYCVDPYPKEDLDKWLNSSSTLTQFDKEEILSLYA